MTIDVSDARLIPHQLARIGGWVWNDEISIHGRGRSSLASCKRRSFGGCSGCSSVLGQMAVDAEGRPLHAGDMRAQVTQALDNLETVVRAAGVTLADVVRLTVYTTDIDRLFTAYDALTGRLAASGCSTPITLVGVTRLAFPDLLVEIEAMAVG